MTIQLIIWFLMQMGYTEQEAQLQSLQSDQEEIKIMVGGGGDWPDPPPKEPETTTNEKVNGDSST